MNTNHQNYERVYDDRRLNTNDLNLSNRSFYDNNIDDAYDNDFYDEGDGYDNGGDGEEGTDDEVPRNRTLLLEALLRANIQIHDEDNDSHPKLLDSDRED